MNIEYMRTAKKSCMIVKDADYPFAQYELRMIQQNDIPCLLPFQLILADGRTQYWYDVSGMQDLKTLFLLENVGGKQIRLFLESFLEMKSAMEAYLLDDTNLCLRAEMIYFDRILDRIRFCYIPGLGSQTAAGAGGLEMEGLKKLSEEMLAHLNHADPPAVRMGYEMYERCARGAFTIDDCAECLSLGESLNPGDPERVIREGDPLWRNDPADIPEEKSDFLNEEVEFLLEKQEPAAGHRRKRRSPPRARAPERGRKAGEGKGEKPLYAPCPDPDCAALPLTAPEEDERTELISEDEAAKEWELAYRGDGPESDFALSQSPFLIGTDARRVNGVLRARTVSRIHAKLYVEGDQLFAEDFNSTNGTYLNQQLLPMNTPVKLKEGDRIVFATEEYAVTRKRSGGASGSYR